MYAFAVIARAAATVLSSPFFVQDDTPVPQLKAMLEQAKKLRDEADRAIAELNERLRAREETKPTSPVPDRRRKKRTLHK
jgi:hypothetical protein